MHALYIAANDHPLQINWAEMKILQRANRTVELVMKETISICTTPEDNQDNGYELPDCFIATFQKLKNGASLSMLCPPTRGN